LSAAVRPQAFTSTGTDCGVANGRSDLRCYHAYGVTYHLGNEIECWDFPNYVFIGNILVNMQGQTR